MEWIGQLIKIQWDTFGSVVIYKGLTFKGLFLGFFIVGCLASFVNMFTHRGE